MEVSPMLIVLSNRSITNTNRLELWECHQCQSSRAMEVSPIPIVSSYGSTTNANRPGQWKYHQCQSSRPSSGIEQWGDNQCRLSRPSSRSRTMRGKVCIAMSNNEMTNRTSPLVRRERIMRLAADGPVFKGA